jgi:hypothetical protein
MPPLSGAGASFCRHFRISNGHNNNEGILFQTHAALRVAWGTRQLRVHLVQGFTLGSLKSDMHGAVLVRIIAHHPGFSAWALD